MKLPDVVSKQLCRPLMGTNGFPFYRKGPKTTAKPMHPWDTLTLFVCLTSAV